LESANKHFIIDNGLITVKFDENGRILSYFDIVNQREIIPSGSLANVFRFYEDIPLFWDAWDVEVYHLEKGWDAGVGKMEIIENGPLRVVLRF
jgi:alpha-mannosidase